MLRAFILKIKLCNCTYLSAKRAVFPDENANKHSEKKNHSFQLRFPEDCKKGVKLSL
jgi:hypothetical protein